LAYLYSQTASDKETLAKASQLCGQALSLQPENPQFLDTAAWVAYKQGDFAGAWNYCQDALANSDKAVHSLHAAMILRGLGEKELALNYLNSALESNTNKLDEKTYSEAVNLKKEWATD